MSRHALGTVATLTLITPALFVTCLLIGAVPVTLTDLIHALWLAPTDSTPLPIIELRLPRVLGAFAIGGSLALAGTLMQVLVRNPLADPYILGVSGGAACAALVGLWLGLSGILFHGMAFGGALFAMLLVFAVAHGRGTWSPVRLLLTGVVLATGWGALISLILALAPDTQLRGMLFWLMGDFSYLESARLEWVALALGTALALLNARDLNVLAHGDLQAAALGVRTERLRVVIYLLTSLLAALAVTAVGSVGFVGLVAPHWARMLTGNAHRYSLVAAVLLGGTLLVIADTIARSVVAPLQLPVGVITALLGIPLFLYLLRRHST
jgi:iron complex transport system permease protein